MKASFILRLATVALAASGLVFLSACSTATVKDVWTAPGVTNIQFNKVLVIAAAMDGKDSVRRRTAEDAIVHALPGVEAVPSYAFLAGTELSNSTKTSTAIKAAGFDAVIVLRMVSERTELNVSPAWDYGYPWGYYGGWGYGPYWYGRRGYWGYGYGGYGYSGLGPIVTTDHIFLLETSIYEFPSEKLIWSGSVESTSPGNVKKMVDDAIGAILEHMAGQKLIPPPVKSR